jgi:hypothetical protein
MLEAWELLRQQVNLKLRIVNPFMFFNISLSGNKLVSSIFLEGVE